MRIRLTGQISRVGLRGDVGTATWSASDCTAHSVGCVARNTLSWFLYKQVVEWGVHWLDHSCQPVPLLLVESGDGRIRVVAVFSAEVALLLFLSQSAECGAVGCMCG